jgi:hypothetical protein
MGGVLLLILVGLVVLVAALVLLAVSRRASRAEAFTDERQLGNHYVGGDLHGTPPGQGWGGGGP